MPISRIVGAPQLTRILREFGSSEISAFLSSPENSDLAGSLCANEHTGPQAVRDRLEKLAKDDIREIEKQAVRIVQLDSPRADALHLRFAKGHKFDCKDELSERPGSFSRALWSYSCNRSLFVAVERAMQVRCFRQHERIFQAYELQTPCEFDHDDFDEEAFAEDIADRLSLPHGCWAEAVELPASGHSPLQYMVALTAAGARESQKTFESNRSVGIVRYRPASELILVYLPESGRIEVCGRQWSDRKVVAEGFARGVLKEDLSERPLTQRSYEISMFRGVLDLEVPDALQDRIRDAEVVELRVALGSYNRKVTLTVTPGEDIDALRRDVFGALGTRHGRGFVCDVELFLRVVLEGGKERTLRFRIDNHNSCTLQSNTDPDLRAIGFELLEAWGVLKTPRLADPNERADIIPLLLRLYDHAENEISGRELAQMGADVSRLTGMTILHRREVVETILIEDEDIGEVLADVRSDLRSGTADVLLQEGDVERTVDLDEVSRWSINRGFILETILEEMNHLKIEGAAFPLNDEVEVLGEIVLSGLCLPVFMAARLGNDRVLRSADEAIRAASELQGGIVLTPGEPPLRHLGTHVTIDLSRLVERDSLSSASLGQAWRARRRIATSGAEVIFEKFADSRAELTIPGQPTWTIIGEKQVLIVERLHKAHRDGEKMVRTSELLEYSGASQMGASFGAEWRNRIRDNYITSPKPKFWALAA